MLDGYPWFDCNGCYPIPAYSEFMPAPRVGRKPIGETDRLLFTEADPFGWHLTEIEEEYELRPGIVHAGNQIMSSLIKLGRGIAEHYIPGHGGENLRDNPYWPAELASRAGTLSHERFVALLPLMLSRTQDDKGRISWSLFGNSIDEPETAFWKCFCQGPGIEIPEDKSVSFFCTILSDAFGERISGIEALHSRGFRILSDSKYLPAWTKSFITGDSPDFENIRYLLTFRPFAAIPSGFRERYLKGSLPIIPFPGSLVFWGMPGYQKMKDEFPLAGQLPLLNLVAHNRGLEGIKVPQAGWFHEPGAGHDFIMNKELLKGSFQRTHRWQRLHRYQDELNEIAARIRLVKVLFSTEPDAMGLYDKPMARNSHIWNHRFEMLLDGPGADRKRILEAERIIIEGGLFGYRFFYPPMKAGEYDVYLHRPLVACLPAGADKPLIRSGLLPGYMTGYHADDREMKNPVEMWPRILKREPYMSALKDFSSLNDRYTHQTSLNILSLLDAFNTQNREPLPPSYARSVLNISKMRDLNDWLEELGEHSANPEAAERMQEALGKIIGLSGQVSLPDPITYKETATRQFEESWWNDIRFLAHGQFINKDNADIAQDETTLSLVKRQKRDLESLGDYLLMRHRKAIADSGMEGIAACGEQSFTWKTDFEFSIFGGWKRNQDNETHERNLLVVIPGRNRERAVVFGDHYDTAYMEDIYDKERGGSGARLSANGADDNYSATSALLQAAPLFLKLSKEGRLETDVWLLHLTGEEFPSDCMGARHFCQSLVENNVSVTMADGSSYDLRDVEIAGTFIMDMIGHNRDNDRDIFQISPGRSEASLNLAFQAHLANQLWNAGAGQWNNHPERRHLEGGKRITDTQQIPAMAKFLRPEGEVRTQYNPHSSLFNTDCQIFSDAGVPVVLFMENYDINRTGYHDSMDTLENIDLDYGAALAAIAIETVARIATDPQPGSKGY